MDILSLESLQCLQASMSLTVLNLLHLHIFILPQPPTGPHSVTLFPLCSLIGFIVALMAVRYLPCCSAGMDGLKLKTGNEFLAG